MERKEFNRKEAKKSLKLSALCLLLMFLSPLILHSWGVLGMLMMMFLTLGFLIFIIRSIILFTGQKFIPTANEAQQNWEEKNKRRCINCGFTGGMINYLNTNKGQAILIILLLFLLLPGIIFWIVVRGKKICPKCQSLNIALI
jgi:hypothetical protein